MSHKKQLAELVESYYSYMYSKHGSINTCLIEKYKMFIDRYYDMKKHIVFYLRLVNHIPTDVAHYLFAISQKNITSRYSLEWYEKNKYCKTE